MAIGDIYQITVKARVNNNDAVNVWYARSTTEETNSEAVALGVVEFGLPELTIVQSVDMEYYEVIARNLFDESDKWTEGISVVGELAEALSTMPLHDAVGVVLNHDNPAIRVGAKRMTGLTEEVVDQYGVLPPAQVANWDSALNAFIDGGVSEEVSEGLFQTIAEYVIVKSVPVIVEGVTGYRLPESAVEAVYGIITSALIKPNITTQVSRKQGVGS